jgi:hypothetical protein
MLRQMRERRQAGQATLFGQSRSMSGSGASTTSTCGVGASGSKSYAAFITFRVPQRAHFWLAGVESGEGGVMQASAIRAVEQLSSLCAARNKESWKSTQNGRRVIGRGKRQAAGRGHLLIPEPALSEANVYAPKIGARTGATCHFLREKLDSVCPRFPYHGCPQVSRRRYNPGFPRMDSTLWKRCAWA